jgi:hypothetical protein
MTIALNKFGTTLVFRQAGKEAFAAFQPSLQNVAEGEEVKVDFAGVLTLSPSWGDEFLSSLIARFNDRVILVNTGNLSVKASLEIIEESRNMKFRIQS